MQPRDPNRRRAGVGRQQAPVGEARPGGRRDGLTALIAVLAAGFAVAGLGFYSSTGSSGVALAQDPAPDLLDDASASDMPEDDLEADGPDAESSPESHLVLDLGPPPATAQALPADQTEGPGFFLPGAPGHLSATALAPTAERLRAAMAVGDRERALHLATGLAERSRSARERDAAWLVIGLLEREAWRPNAASAAFTRVRAAEGPLAPFGAFYEAEQDLSRGRAAVAVRECEAYRATWPDGPHATACLRVEALGWAALGNRTQALATAERYDRDHEIATITEQIELHLAEVEARTAPERAIPRLIGLAQSHQAPLTGRVAEQLLAALQAEGYAQAALPTDTPSLMTRAISLRGAGRAPEAMAVLEELSRRAQDDPRLASWVESQAPEFGWRLRQWDLLIPLLESQYAKRADAEVAWSLFKACSRAGRHADAARWAQVGMAEHGASPRWSRVEDAVGRELMLAGQYPLAREHFDAAARRGGWSGRQSAFTAAFASHMAGEHEEAVRRLDAIVTENRGHVEAARYWRARALDALQETERAEGDRAWLAANAPLSWYGRLSDPSLPEAAPFRRDGRWAGPSLPTFPRRPAPVGTGVVAHAAPVFSSARASSPAFARLVWTPVASGPSLASQPPLAPPLVAADLTRPPPSYPAGPFFDPERARELADALVDSHGETWPLLAAIFDLAAVGLYDLSGPLMASFYEDVEDARRQWSHPRHAQARALQLAQEEWRLLFLLTRDHHHATRFTNGLAASIPEPQVARDTLRLAWPLAHDRYVWERAREQDLDPLLVLGLMRQESVYDPLAVSRAGARGAMQIMPRTGHRIADLTADLDYTAADLEDPIFAIGYGVTYLGMLMQRFDGVYPLAIASYNGGPHNVSSWLAGTGPDMPMDAFVEHIPFRETRGYVQSVSEHYATYVALYAPVGTEVVVPGHPAGDHAEVVDF